MQEEYAVSKGLAKDINELKVYAAEAVERREEAEREKEEVVKAK